MLLAETLFELVVGSDLLLFLRSVTEVVFWRVVLFALMLKGEFKGLAVTVKAQLRSVLGAQPPWAGGRKLSFEKRLEGNTCKSLAKVSRT